MSENSPRWPGTDGSPGLDFSPWRRTSDENLTNGATDTDAEGSTDTAASADPDAAEVESSDTATEDKAVDEAKAGAEVDEEPARAADPLEDTVISTDKPTPPAKEDPAPASAASAPKVDESMYRGSGSTSLTPKANERAATTAAAWANTPIGGVSPMPPAGAPVPLPAGSPVPAPARGTDSADVAEATPVVKKEKRTRAARRTRKARLRLARLDPWSVMKTTFLFSIAFGIMLVVATFVVWSVLQGSGAIDSVNQFLNTALGDANTTFDISGILSLERIMGFAAVIAAIDVVIITALATLAAFLYNLAATVMGGLEVTLAED